MSIPHSTLFPRGYPLLQRLYFDVPGGPYSATAPAKALWVRASAGGCGGFKDDANGWGGGGAFAFDAELCAAGDAFTVQVGDTAFSRPSADTVAGDSWVKRPGGSVLVYADRGRHGGAGGLVANCTGSIKRAGVASTPLHGGASAGDDADDHARGFGGRGASTSLAAYYGGGGGFDNGRSLPLVAAADGRVCVEFYSRNPGY